jgi:hypothetical protein
MRPQTPTDTKSTAPSHVTRAPHTHITHALTHTSHTQSQHPQASMDPRLKRLKMGGQGAMRAGDMGRGQGVSLLSFGAWTHASWWLVADSTYKPTNAHQQPTNGPSQHPPNRWAPPAPARPASPPPARPTSGPRPTTTCSARWRSSTAPTGASSPTTSRRPARYRWGDGGLEAVPVGLCGPLLSTTVPLRNPCQSNPQPQSTCYPQHPSHQGVNRRPEWCKARYAVLQKTPMEVGGGWRVPLLRPRCVLAMLPCCPIDRLIGQRSNQPTDRP